MALQFFTLRIPCSNLGDRGAPVSFSPAYGVLHIAQTNWDEIVDFLPRLADWDSGGRGVLHLALGSRLVCEHGDALEQPAAREGLATAIARLQSLWIVNLEAEDVRIMSSLTWRAAKCHHSRSVPIFASVQIFDRIPGPDPRPIETDLGQVASFDDLGLEVRL